MAVASTTQRGGSVKPAPDPALGPMVRLFVESSKSANFLPLCYQNTRQGISGLSLYYALTQASTYYPGATETGIFSDADTLNAMVAAISGVTMAIDLGVGPYEAFAAKSGFLTDTLRESQKRLRQVAGVDTSSAAHASIRESWGARPYEYSAHDIDFFSPNAREPLGALRTSLGSDAVCWLMTGLTIGNDTPQAGVVLPQNTSEFLSTIAHTMGEKDRLVLTVDCTQDPHLLRAAYNSPAAQRFFKHALWVLKDRVDQSFNPNKLDITAVTETVVGGTLLRIVAVPQEPLDISYSLFVDGRPRRYKHRLEKGGTYNLAVSAKPTGDYLGEILRAAGLHIKAQHHPPQRFDSDIRVIVAQRGRSLAVRG